METGTVFLVIVVIVVAWMVLIYNYLVQLRENVKNGWAQIDVQLKRRHDLIPNLVDAAKGYMMHERETLDTIVKSRQHAVDAKSLRDIQESENFLTGALGRLSAVFENYPQLKADRQMVLLQEELVSTENKITLARQYYNEEVTRLNVTLKMFPNNLIASFFHFSSRPLFEIKDQIQKEPAKVKF